jgi:hypothetical protein
LEQIIGFVFFDFEVGVAGNSEGMDLTHQFGGKESIEIRRNDLFDPYKTTALGSGESCWCLLGIGGDGDEAWQYGGYLDAHKALILLIANDDRQIKT